MRGKGARVMSAGPSMDQVEVWVRVEVSLVHRQ
jgi:hypothetical protein